LSHGDTKKTEEKIANVAGISPTEIPWSKFPQPVLETFQEKEEMKQHAKPLLPPLDLPSRNRGVYFGHGIPVGGINATFVFLLCVSVSLAVLGGW